jgi:hypothetical protein
MGNRIEREGVNWVELRGVSLKELDAGVARWEWR